MKPESRISISRIEQAVAAIDPVFLNSPQFKSRALSDCFQLKLIIKDETQNPVGCFKGRGAALLVSKHKDNKEIICASAGNFGQAMAYSAGKYGKKLTVFASHNANPYKVRRMKELGAELILEGEDFDEAKLAAKEFAAKTGKRFVEDSLDIETVEGAGTIGLELIQYKDKLDCILIALGNGAMLTGIAKVFKHYSPSTKIIAVQAKGAPAMIESWQKGKVINYTTANTTADGIAVRLPIPEVLSDMNGLVDEGLLVDDTSIIKAMELLEMHENIIAEPSAAVGLAAIIENTEMFRNKTVAVIICGANKMA